MYFLNSTRQTVLPYEPMSIFTELLSLKGSSELNAVADSRIRENTLKTK